MKTRVVFAVLGIALLPAPEAKAAVLSLLHFDGGNGSTTFADEIPGNTWSGAGGAHVSNSPAKFGSGALNLDGSGDFISLADSSALYPAGAFTADFWMRTANAMQSNTYLAGKSHPDGGLGFDIRLDNRAIRVAGVNGWGFNITTAELISDNTWHHIALSSTESAVYLFVDGTLAGNCPRGFITATSNPFRIGYQSNFGGSAFNGLIDEFRFTNAAEWTANFTPPSEPHVVPEPGSATLFALGSLLALGSVTSASRRRPLQ